VAAGADVDVQNKSGVTALTWAAGLGHNKVVHELIQAKADVNIADNESWTALMRAVNNGNKEAMDQLLKAGADPRAVNQQGESILDIARMQGKDDVIDIIEKKLSADEDAHYAPIVKGTLHEVKTIKTISFKPRTPAG
jgi:ankyrin repeat protein